MTCHRAGSGARWARRRRRASPGGELAGSLRVEPDNPVAAKKKRILDFEVLRIVSKV